MHPQLRLLLHAEDAQGLRIVHEVRAGVRRPNLISMRTRLQLPAQGEGAQGLSDIYRRCMSQLHPLLMRKNNSPACVQGEEAQGLAAKHT